MNQSLNEVLKMTDVIIIHSKYGNATNHWYEWLKHNLTLEGLSCDVV